MNFQMKLNNSLNEILRASGNIYEIIYHNKKNSNMLSGFNNQIVTQYVSSNLANSIKNFDEILDETIFKFNETKWYIEKTLEKGQKQKESSNIQKNELLPLVKKENLINVNKDNERLQKQEILFNEKELDDIKSNQANNIEDDFFFFNTDNKVNLNKKNSMDFEIEKKQYPYISGNNDNKFVDPKFNEAPDPALILSLIDYSKSDEKKSPQKKNKDHRVYNDFININSDVNLNNNDDLSNFLNEPNNNKKDSFYNPKVMDFLNIPINPVRSQSDSKSIYNEKNLLLDDVDINLLDLEIKLNDISNSKIDKDFDVDYFLNRFNNFE